MKLRLVSDVYICIYTLYGRILSPVFCDEIWIFGVGKSWCRIIIFRYFWMVLYWLICFGCNLVEVGMPMIAYFVAKDMAAYIEAGWSRVVTKAEQRWNTDPKRRPLTLWSWHETQVTLSSAVFAAVYGFASGCQIPLSDPQPRWFSDWLQSMSMFVRYIHYFMSRAVTYKVYKIWCMYDIYLLYTHTLTS